MIDPQVGSVWKKKCDGMKVVIRAADETVVALGIGQTNLHLILSEPIEHFCEAFAPDYTHPATEGWLDAEIRDRLAESFDVSEDRLTGCTRILTLLEWGTDNGGELLGYGMHRVAAKLETLKRLKEKKWEK